MNFYEELVLARARCVVAREMNISIDELKVDDANKLLAAADKQMAKNRIERRKREARERRFGIVPKCKVFKHSEPYTPNAELTFEVPTTGSMVPKPDKAWAADDRMKYWEQSACCSVTPKEGQ